MGVAGNVSVSGNVGIGTSIPTAKLHVNGSGYFSGTLSVNSVNTLDKAIAVTNNSAENFLVYGDGFCFARRFEAATGTFIHPDYVFRKNYTLMPIEELKNYLQKEKHHPNFLSEKQYKKKGRYDLLEMDMNLLKTSEELTLYVIQQHEEMKLLKQTVAKQNETIDVLKKDIQTLKKKLK